MKRITIILLILAGGSLPELSAQSVQNDSLDFTYEVIAEPNSQPEANGDTLFHYTAVVRLDDTDSLKKIHVRMGTQPDSSNVLNHNFKFDKDTRLPRDLSYRRDSNVIRLGLGKHYAREYFYEIKLEDSSSNYSSANKHKGRYHSRPDR